MVHSAFIKQIMIFNAEKGFHFESLSQVSREKFANAIDLPGEKHVRFKGNVNFSDGMKFVEIVFGRLTEAKPASKLSTSSAFTDIGLEHWTRQTEANIRVTVLLEAKARPTSEEKGTHCFFLSAREDFYVILNMSGYYRGRPWMFLQ